MYIRSFYKHIEIESHSFGKAFYIAKNTFGMHILRNYEQQQQIDLPRKEYHSKYYEKNKDKLKDNNKKKYRKKKDLRTNPTQEVAAPAAPLTERKIKKKAKKRAAPAASLPAPKKISKKSKKVAAPAAPFFFMKKN